MPKSLVLYTPPFLILPPFLGLRKLLVIYSYILLLFFQLHSLVHKRSQHCRFQLKFVSLQKEARIIEVTFSSCRTQILEHPK